ncbi:MAG: hypothetical protein QM757_46145 [Paludibaculum sp.]
MGKHDAPGRARDRLSAAMAEFTDIVKSTPPADPERPVVLLPGEIEYGGVPPPRPRRPRHPRRPDRRTGGIGPMTLPMPAGAVDCHMHVFAPVEDYPPAPGRAYTPRPANLQQYLTMADEVGLQRSVFVQAEPRWGRHPAAARHASSRPGHGGGAWR